MSTHPNATPILQFGTSRFLQAHADLFFCEANEPRRVTVVQSSGDAARAHRLAGLTREGGYEVRIRGLSDGAVVDETRRVDSVTRALSTATDWDEIVRIASEEAQIILSNTGDAGFEPKPDDEAPEPAQAMSYPAKLFHVLAARHRTGGAPVTIMPTELISNNGAVLKARIMEIAAANRADDGLLAFLEGCIWVNSLVDRIVSEPLEPAGAVAEPYALWAIEKTPGLVAPCLHSDVKLVDDLKPYERLKLYILNLGHSALVDLWRQRGAPEAEVVREIVAGPDRAALDALFAEEILPGFAAKGMGEEARAYLATTLERMENPFLDHRLADIAQNHRQKVMRRMKAFREWVGPEALPMPRVGAIIDRAA
ncbi:mannitol dehydrogenase family protein [Acuticoccus sp. M5D2P5]|uniref:mannitol dehydrogenase family protein n=1 Tax=Acuticoccus kalidii TaxID=2910977 RepID=UPI001F18407D|nr:mannitol dehydrogenase family protein [Acuticoccus kalidii]MCF3932546.1 mannitol dehydrogenase family protein [Acuticoccus kalidii]